MKELSSGSQTYKKLCLFIVYCLLDSESDRNTQRSWVAIIPVLIQIQLRERIC